MRSASVRVSVELSAVLVVLAAAISSANAQMPLSVTASVADLSPQWAPVPPANPDTPSATAPLGASVQPPTPPYPCTLYGPVWNWNLGTPQYSPDGSTWSAANSSDYTAWIVQPTGAYAAATLNVNYNVGGYWQFPCIVNVGYWDSCNDVWSGTATGTSNGTSVQLISLTVISGATQTNVTGADNWAAVKTKAGDTVLTQAKTMPDNADGWAQIQWTGGNAGATANQRTVDKGTSAKTTVTAKIGNNSMSVNVWILWATIQILTANPKPANAPNFPATVDDGTQNLGAVTWNNGNQGAGKICAVGSITPAGVNQVVTQGWNFRRDKWRHCFKDGAKDPNFYDATWQGDDSPNLAKTSSPDTTDKIYDIDGPNIGNFGQTDSYEIYDNFREYIQWNGDMCSDYTGWYYEARRKNNNTGTNQVTLNQVSAGALDLNNFTTAFYPAP